MKCDLCGGENIGLDFVCDTCGTRLSRAPGGSAAIEPHLSRPPSAPSTPDPSSTGAAIRAARLAELLGRSPSAPFSDPVTTAFRSRSGQVLQVDVPPVPPVVTDSAATPADPVGLPEAPLASIEAPGSGTARLEPTLRASGATRPHAARLATDRSLVPDGPLVSDGKADANAARAGSRTATGHPPDRGLIPSEGAYPSHWSSPQQERAARESSNLHRAAVGVLVAAAVAFGLTMEWSGADNKPTLHPGKTPAPLVARAGRAAPNDAVASNADAAPNAPASTVAEAASAPTAARHQSVPSDLIAANDTAGRHAESTADTPREPPASSRSSTNRDADPRKTIASSGSDDKRPSGSVTAEAASGAAGTSAKSEGPRTSRSAEKTASAEVAARAAPEHPRAKSARSATKRRREMVASAKTHRKDEIGRLRVEAFSETSADRVGPPSPPQAEPVFEASRRVREHPRHVIRSAYRQCERLETFFDRERCKWRICDGKWGQGECPAYKRASLY